MTLVKTRNVRRVIQMAAVVLAAAIVSTLMITTWVREASAQTTPVGLGTAGDFSVLAASTATNTGPTVLSQNLGVSPGSAATGFPPGIVEGEIHLADAVALQAQQDLTTAYNDAASRTPFTTLPAELGGSTLGPGVYRLGAAEVTGELTLDAQGDPQAVFIFQMASTLVTASGSSVVFINGASACNVYWQVGSSATLGTNTSFVGNIMAQASITMTTGATLEGRALARTAAVTLDSNLITEPVCDTTPTATPTVPPTATPTPTVPPTATPTPTVPPTATPTPTVPPTATPTPTVPPTYGPTAPPPYGPTAPPSYGTTAPPPYGPTATPTYGNDAPGGSGPVWTIWRWLTTAW